MMTQEAREHRHRLATYTAFVTTIFVGIVCFAYFGWMTPIWQQPYSETCQGLCGDIWQYKPLWGAAEYRADYWQPVASLYVAVCLFFFISYAVFWLEYTVAQAVTDTAYRQRLWWWRGLNVWAKVFCVGFAAFWALVTIASWLILTSAYFASLAFLVFSMLPIMIPAMGIGSLIGMRIFNYCFDHLGKRPSYWPQLIFAFIIVSGTAAVTFSVMVLPVEMLFSPYT